jgi:hypothetical protein
VSHVRFRITGAGGDLWFSLRAPEGPTPDRDLFIGNVTADMPAQLRALADHLDGASGATPAQKFHKED